MSTHDPQSQQRTDLFILFFLNLAFWVSRPQALTGNLPRQCPACRSWKWNVPRKQKPVDKGTSNKLGLEQA